MRLKIEHTTRYRFDTPVVYGLQQLRKTPKSTFNQKVVSWETRIEGGKKETSFEDHHRNTTELISFDPNTLELSVISEGEVELEDNGGILGPHQGCAPLWLYDMTTPRTQAGAGTRALIKGLGDPNDVSTLHKLSERIRDAVPYTLGASNPDWSAEDALEAAKGVCQDHSHIFITCARAMGLPARYVSGYLMLNDTTTQEAMHAWAEAHVPGLGWVGFDVSNAISPDTRYIRVATGLDYSDAAPISGTRIGGAGEDLNVQIHVIQQ
ncbi:transglutaminase family protein [Marivita hallyeonensis]|uniref:Transglutaminase-like enzyme, putative cysteine protease n=1 Tax=Marivita hallyeonensis TaxID=996342 RepID=A0A1M5X549_9RHOB|nr:transglutaminase family protein [Marivita hallyeonensis]SHH94614.1 Transglutaminase-like enzyme, putative cysteine protease [Marivita hallyeonensis]